MPYAPLPGSRIYYEEYGAGHPVLALAPGGLDSRIDYWRRRKTGEPRDFPNPLDFLPADFRVIALDQRNAGRSTGRVGPQDGWHTYCADYLALMDHLGIDRFHVIGACIGGPLGFKLMEMAPGRVTAFVVQGSMGLGPDTRPLIEQSFDAWAADLLAREPGIDPGHLQAMKQRLYESDFVFSVDRDFMRKCPAPLLVLAGHDARHPQAISEEIAGLAPDARLVMDWQGEPRQDTYRREIREFLLARRPA